MIWKTRSLMTSIKLLLLLHGSESPKSEELLDSAADIMRRCKWKWRWKSVGSLNSDLLKRKQHGQETKEEKKERKVAVKREQSEAQRTKKAMKELYQSEAQQAQKVAAIASPSSIRLM